MSAARLMLEWAILLALAIAGALWAQSNGIMDRLDNQLFDTAAPLARPAIDSDIVIVAIDDRSLAEVGAWPWPRSVHADLVERLSKAGARLVVLDILFLEQTQGEGDAALADAMESSGAVFLPHTFIARPNAVSGIDPLMPIAPLAQASAGTGHVVAEPDSDGVLRRFDLTLETDRAAFPHIALKVLEALGEARKGSGEGEALIPFHPEAAFQRESAAEVLAGATLDGFFEGKIVLVGATGQGMGDRYSVATGSVELMTGIGSQANLLGALRQDALIVPASAWVQGGVAVIGLFALFLGFWYLPPRWVLICAAGLVMLVLVGSLAALGFARVWFAPASIMVAVLFSYPLWSWRRLSRVSRYLDHEAARLLAHDSADAPSSGLDYVTAQIVQLRRLISTVRGSLTFLRQVIEAAPDAIVVLDRDGRVEMLNEKALALFPDWKTQAGATFMELLLFSGARQQRDGSELLTADRRTYLIARAGLAENADNSGGGEIIALRDVSDLRRLDDERKQMLEFLSHDMRTPQVAIVGLTEGVNGSGMGRDVVTRIRKQAERTLKLADDFVQLARLGSSDLQLADTDISAVVDEACDRAWPQAEAKGIRIVQDIPDDPCFAEVDASLIARMLDNLIGNAIKYSDSGTEIAVSLCAPNSGELELQVADQGPGLSEARLVEPFARFGAHATDAGPSAGLGLALVKRVVDAHEARIALASKPGEGTTFTITLAGEMIVDAELEVDV